MRFVGAVPFLLGALVPVDEAAIKVFKVTPSSSIGGYVTSSLFT